jgi:hypothetical protein
MSAGRRGFGLLDRGAQRASARRCGDAGAVAGIHVELVVGHVDGEARRVRRGSPG